MTSTARSAGSAAVAFSLTFGLVSLLAEQPAAAAETADFTVVAPDERDYLTERVSAADLDLSRQQDVRRLELRIKAASRRVCDVPTITLIAPSQTRCARIAREGAAPQVARLVDRARSLAAAGLPSRIETVLTVVAPGSE